jgi:hypothetical protein
MHGEKVDYYVTFKVLTEAIMKMAVFCVVAPCGLVEVYRRFRNAYETSVNFY